VALADTFVPCPFNCCTTAAISFRGPVDTRTARRIDDVLESWRWRGSYRSRLVMAVRGTPITLMSARNFDDDGNRLGRVVEQISRRLDRGQILSQSCGFKSPPSDRLRRARRWPSSVTRTFVPVGRPWMLEGKICASETALPWRRIEPRTVRWRREPEPLTLAKRRRIVYAAESACGRA